LDSTSEVGDGRLQKVTEGTVHIIRKVSWESEGSPWQSISDTFQSRLQGLYSQDNTANKERDFMELAKEWNNSGSQDEERNLGRQDEAIYVLGNEEDVKTQGVSRNDSGINFVAMLQGLYGQPEGPNKEQNFMTLART